jgi:hypothetical protein
MKSNFVEINDEFLGIICIIINKLISFTIKAYLCSFNCVNIMINF